MSVDIREVSAEALEEYAGIPIRFHVDSVLRIKQIDGGLGGLQMVEEKLDEPYVKDYDAEKQESPTRWPKRFDVSNWGIFLACRANRPTGGVAVAFHSPDVDMLEGRTDLAVLWDIRVHPDERGQGIGTRLFRHAGDWARARGCSQLKIETQNINVGACRFYAKQGCHLGAIVRRAYGEPHLAHEVMLVWYLDL